MNASSLKFHATVSLELRFLIKGTGLGEVCENWKMSTHSFQANQIFAGSWQP